MTATFSLMRRLILRPMWSDPVRSSLSLLSVALGVAVVVAIRLAGDAAAGSFRSSMESLQGDATLEITSPGGIDENYLGRLAELPYPLEFTPRINAYARIVATQQTVPLFGMDLIHRAGDNEGGSYAGDANFSEIALCSDALACRKDAAIELIINDRKHTYRVAGTLPGVDPFMVLDISEAQAATGRTGRLDSIQVHTPPNSSTDWPALLRGVLPSALEIQPVGA